jgi:hypothetical protein
MKDYLSLCPGTIFKPLITFFGYWSSGLFGGMILVPGPPHLIFLAARASNRLWHKSPEGVEDIQN